MPRAPQTVLGVSPSPIPRLESISLLPCSLAFDGPAPVSTYFHPRPYSPPEGPATATATESASHRQAAFRGRRLISSLAAVPSGYTGLVFSTRAAVAPRASNSDDVQAEVESARAEKNRNAREERAAKRAKLDHDSTATATRTSPRKAAKDARDRAIRAARDKAKGKTGTVVKKFSLDDDDDDDEDNDGDDAIEKEEGERRRLDQEIPERERDAAAQEPPAAETVEAEEGFPAETRFEPDDEGYAVDATEATTAKVVLASSSGGPALAVVSSAPTGPEADPLLANANNVAAPAPLLSRTSTSLSTHLDLPTTPSAQSSSVVDHVADVVADDNGDERVQLARDEKYLSPVSTFSTIEVWNPDFMIAGGRVLEEDSVARSVHEWIGLAHKIHAY